MAVLIAHLAQPLVEQRQLFRPLIGAVTYPHDGAVSLQGRNWLLASAAVPARHAVINSVPAKRTLEP